MLKQIKLSWQLSYHNNNNNNDNAAVQKQSELDARLLWASSHVSCQLSLMGKQSERNYAATDDKDA